MRTLAFDLDLTLIETRPGFRAALAALAASSGSDIDVDQAVRRLGIPMAEELALWFEDELVPEAVDLLRTLFLDVGVGLCTAYPTAVPTLRNLRGQGVEIQVVTSRQPKVAWELLEATGLAPLVSHLDGQVFGAEKVLPLRRTGAVAFVGDHPADISAAVEARTTPIAVTTGNHSAAQLRKAGATLVIGALDELLRPDLEVWGSAGSDG